MNLKGKLRNGWSVAAVPFVFLFIIPNCLIQVPGDRGGDFSYLQALLYVITSLKEAYFGTDITYTAGPLVFLRFRLVNSLSMVYSIFIFDLFIAANLVYIILKFFPLKNYFHFVALLVTLYFIGRDYTEILYSVILLYNCFQYLKEQKRIFLVNILIVSVLSVFIKLNFAFSQSILVLFFSIYLLKTKKISTKVFISFWTLFAISTIALAGLLNVHLQEYVTASLQFISGYNEAMLLQIGWSQKLLQSAVMILFSLAFIFLVHLVIDFKNYDSTIRILMLSTSVFVLFKFGFVRSDHYQMFYRHILLILSPLLLYENGTVLKLSRYLYLSALATCCVFLLSDPVFGKNDLKGMLSFSYFSQLIHPEKVITHMNDLREAQIIPSAIKKRIVKGTVDVIDKETSLAFSNNLNYYPRPTVQSYCAYNYFLDTLNCIHFNSSKAPDFILYTNGTIDDRYALWDESITKRALLTNYTVSDSFRMLDYLNKPITYFVMEKNKVRKKFTEPETKEFILQLNQKLFPDTSSQDIQFLYADIQYTWYGKLRSFLFQPAVMIFFICFDDDVIWHFRAIPNILKTGVILNRRATTTAEMYSYFATSGRVNKKVKWIYFTTESKYSFKDIIRCNIKQMTVLK